MRGDDEAIRSLATSVFVVPTEVPESDGTFSWDRTVVVVVEVDGGGSTGIGWSYTTAAAAHVVDDVLAPAVIGVSVLDVDGAWGRMQRAVRNVGRPGIASAAISAVDIALWDLKSKILDLPLVRLLGSVRAAVPVYGSGGFTSYDDAELVEQLAGWVERGIRSVKMKVATGWGSEEARDIERVGTVRKALGGGPSVFVDANGGYSRGQAVRLARHFEDLGVSWFEEPVSSDDLVGLRQVRERTTIEVAAGEYGWDLASIARMCDAEAVDVLQIDVTRCGGITEWIRAAALAAGHGLEVSGHTAQTLHVHVACAVPNVRHLEYFHDHERLERMLFEGIPEPRDGELGPSLDRPGIGVELKRSDASRWAA
jgi:L-alanine-DL-glutamate epimerase-like enolase superfamily enzyme